jgi:TonB family protein
VKLAPVFALTWAPLAVSTALAQTKPGTNGRLICPPVRTKLLKKVQPVYPVLARQAHTEGKVRLWCIIGTDGLVEKIEVTEGPPLLVEAATKAVSQWKYKPLVLNGKAVEVDTSVDFIFKLPKAQTTPIRTNLRHVRQIHSGSQSTLCVLRVLCVKFLLPAELTP